MLLTPITIRHNDILKRVKQVSIVSNNKFDCEWQNNKYIFILCGQWRTGRILFRVQNDLSGVGYKFLTR